MRIPTTPSTTRPSQTDHWWVVLTAVGPEPGLTGDPTVDALIGASVAHRARQLGCPVRPVASS